MLPVVPEKHIPGKLLVSGVQVKSTIQILREQCTYRQGHKVMDNAKTTNVSLATGQGSNLQSQYHTAALHF